MTRSTAVRAAALVVSTCLVAVGLLSVGGRTVVDATVGLPDPGLTTRVGLASARGLRDLAAALTVGGLVVVASMLPGSDPQRALVVGSLRGRIVVWLTKASLVWAAASLAVVAFTYSDLAGRPLWDPIVYSRIWYFAIEFELGRLLLLSAVLVAATTAMLKLTRSMVGVGASVVLAGVALWPLALTGHASGSSSHDLGVNMLFFHLVAITVWFGGLATVAVWRSSLADALPEVVGRYSRVAGVCIVVVAVSGLVSAGLRLGWEPLVTTGYGSMVVLKVLALIALGALGYVHRRRVLPRLTHSRVEEFRRLVAVELVLMGAAVGVGVALGQTAPPVPQTESVDRVEALLGGAIPPELTPGRWLWSWESDSWWLPVAVVAASLYVGAVRRLARRGDHWPLRRTASWIVGCALLVWATSGAPGAYAEVLFSMHMVQHMTLATGVPVFLALGGPVTLALRALARRQDGSLGPREWLLLVVHTPMLRLLGHPAVAAALFIVSLVAFYYSGLLELSLRSHTAHIVMVAHFIATGYLFANGVVGIDPGPARPIYPYRVLIVMVTFGFHALFSVSLMSSTQILAGSWFKSLGRTWGPSLADDQYLGASIGWALGDYPLAVLAAALIWAWVRSDRREAARIDRRHDRDGGAEMAAYNEYLQSLAQHHPPEDLPARRSRL
ncbi:cytochrome c oxidase assembly protein [Nocardioides aurantiacus]|uniref:Putative copper resistance protein D n=1 Tax=Nocardioides aurantiacus TaxID=86796 RepID=A0A3N2CWA3_9ACTN|nr:cytochrome c oxidase assembly protein [Nocardioides aurantiacus]ROR91832.1 putative copper resistance protein D [Nocardioides aurantiacus]